MKSVIRSFGRFGLGAFFFAVMFLTVDSLLVLRVTTVTRPAAYARSDYWSEAFAEESSNLVDLISVRKTTVGDIRTSIDFDGLYINVSNGLRRTEPVPASPSQQIVAFGGSTTFCGEVPDALTWPSQLARQVFDREIEVINAGSSGATFADRVKAFEGLGLTDTSDIAIFFVGVNDAVIGSQSNQVVGLLAHWPRLRRLIEVTLSWSNLGRIVLDRSQQLSFNITLTPAEAVDQFRQTLNRAEITAIANNVRLLVILQPNRLMANSPTWGNPIEGVDPNFVKSFTDFYRHVINKPEFQHRIVDGTRIFDSLDESPYLDYMHVQEEGNRAIASFIYDEVNRRGWLE